jgi:hypothetical protein
LLCEVHDDSEARKHDLLSDSYTAILAAQTAQLELTRRRNERLIERMGAFNDLGERLSRSPTEWQLLTQIVHHAPKVMNASFASCALVDDETETYQLYAMDHDAFSQGRPVPLAGTAVGAAIERMQVVRTGHASRVAYRDDKRLAQRGIRSVITAPLIAGGRAIGTLNVGAERRSAFDTSDVQILQQVASVLASNIELRRTLVKLDYALRDSERVLHHVLPERVAERLKHGEQRIAEQRDGVSVMFIDIVGFTEIAEHTDPLSLVAMLESVFGVFETLCLDHGMLKIKTIGDAFMAVGGVLEDCDDAARRAADTALAMMQAREGLSESYVFRPRGVVELKGIGEQQVRHLLRRTHQDAAAG